MVYVRMLDKGATLLLCRTIYKPIFMLDVVLLYAMITVELLTYHLSRLVRYSSFEGHDSRMLLVQCIHNISRPLPTTNYPSCLPGTDMILQEKNTSR